MLDPDWEGVLERGLKVVLEPVPEWEFGSDLMVFDFDLKVGLGPDLVVDPEPGVAMLLGSD